MKAAFPPLPVSEGYPRHKSDEGNNMSLFFIFSLILKVRIYYNKTKQKKQLEPQTKNIHYNKIVVYIRLVVRYHF